MHLQARAYCAFNFYGDHLKKTKFMPDHAVSLAYEKVVNCFVTSFEMELRNIITSIEIDEESVFTSEKGVDYKKLKQFVRPALFGKGNKTVYDKSVRKAFDIPAERLVIKRNSEDLDYICEILSKQMERYAPDGFILKPKLYKLQAYEKGGFFKAHRDTLHGDNHFATLLVSLSRSSDYEGGNLILTDSNRNEQTFKLTRGTALFFLTDTVHEVTRVKKGERIALQFDVYLENKRTKATSSFKFKNFMSDELDNENEFEMYRQKVPLGTTKKAENTLKLLQEIDKFVQKHPRTISSFFLEHSYHVGITPDYLRGSDRFLYEILSDKYDIEFGSVINEYETNYEGTFEGIDRFNFKIVDGPLAKEFISKIDMSKSYKVKERQRPLFFGSSCSPDCIGRTHYVEYTGNDASPGEYAYHMIVLSIFNPKSAEKCSDSEIENSANVSDSNNEES